MFTPHHDRTHRQGWPLRTSVATLAAGTLLLTPWSTPPASAHGSVRDPLSRIYGCYQRWADDWMNPDMEKQDPMCYQAWQHPSDPMWAWHALYREGTGGDFQAFIPDNQLCSAGRVNDGQFAAMDTPGPWKTTQVDSTFTVDLYDEAKHGADYLQVYVTKQGYDAETDALDWGDLELVAETGKQAPASHYYADVNAPGRSGHHVVYTIWKASHGDQIYFPCSDVTF
jgi:predicted carbohydrate-binding protein with CBM5 and CBM33 domain